jgi:hypothetical protein
LSFRSFSLPSALPATQELKAKFEKAQASVRSKFAAQCLGTLRTRAPHTRNRTRARALTNVVQIARRRSRRCTGREPTRPRPRGSARSADSPKNAKRRSACSARASTTAWAVSSRCVCCVLCVVCGVSRC